MPMRTFNTELTTNATNPFISATKQTFSTMLNCVPERESLTFKANGSGPPPYEVSAIINVTGSADGLVLLSMPVRTSLNIVSRILRTKAESLNDEVIDAVGEVTNIICGAAKVQMEELQLQIDIPTVVVGRNRVIRYPGQITPLSAGFSSEIGEFALEFGFHRSE
ncbi:chemotaxis protein CheX [Thalassoroseus pseudoceratinae]|uniref:chemotaxis protein CheX n=1 Tax=Thalassoroseus pseudoceratinae TaxID=2713176 RepID=UPI00141E0C31|nr:chemotaxis protein CheX [Thalassoroseus pseudoceratinae]